MDGTRGFSRPVTPAHRVQGRVGLAPASGVTTKEANGVPGDRSGFLEVVRRFVSD